MTANEMTLITRVNRLERRLWMISAAALVAVAAAAFGAIGSLTTKAGAADQGAKTFEHLRVRELDVVDAVGTTRVKLAAPLPMPTINGKVGSRGGGADATMSGILLFDASGGERSGYATVDKGYSNVMLTLDEPGGKQHAMFIAEPNGSATLRLFDATRKDRADLAIGSDGPYVSLVRGGKEIYRQPTP